MLWHQLKALLFEHLDLLHVRYPIAFHRPGLSDVVCSDLTQLLNKFPVYLQVKHNANQIASLLAIPLYLSDREQQMSNTFQEFIKHFPRSVESNEAKQDCTRRFVVIFKSSTVGPPLTTSLDYQGTTYWMTWPEKLLLICMVLYGTDRFCNLTSVSNIIAPGAVHAVVRVLGLKCTTASFMLFDQKRENDTFRRNVFDPLLAWDYWNYVEEAKYLPASHEYDDGGVGDKERVKMQSELYYLMMASCIARFDRSTSKHEYQGWTRTLMFHNSSGDRQVAPGDTYEYRKQLQPYFDSKDDKMQAKDIKFSGYALLVNSFLKNGGKKNYELLSSSKDDQHTHAVDPHIKRLPVESMLYDFISNCVGASCSDDTPRYRLPMVIPHAVNIISRTTLLDMLHMNRELALLGRFSSMFARQSTDSLAIVCVHGHLGMLVRAYVGHIAYLFDCHTPNMGYVSQMANIRDVYHNGTGDLVVLTVLPSELLLLVNCYGAILAMRESAGVQDGPCVVETRLSSGIFPLMHSVMNTGRYPMKLETEGGKAWKAVSFETRILPVLLMLRALVVDKDHCRVDHATRTTLLKHASLMGRLFMHIFADNSAFGKLMALQAPRVSLGEVLLTWLVIPFAQAVRLRKAKEKDCRGVRTAKTFADKLRTDGDAGLKEWCQKKDLVRLCLTSCLDAANTTDYIALLESRPMDAQLYDDLTPKQVNSFLLGLLDRLLMLAETHPQSQDYDGMLACILLSPSVLLHINRNTYETLFPFHVSRTRMFKVKSEASRDEPFRAATPSGMCPRAMPAGHVNDSAKHADRVITRAIAMAMGLHAPRGQDGASAFNAFVDELHATVCVPNVSVLGRNINDTVMLPMYVRNGEVIHPHVHSMLNEFSTLNHTADVDKCPLYCVKRSSPPVLPCPAPLHAGSRKRAPQAVDTFHAEGRDVHIAMRHVSPSPQFPNNPLMHVSTKRVRSDDSDKFMLRNDSPEGQDALLELRDMQVNMDTEEEEEEEDHNSRATPVGSMPDCLYNDTNRP